MHYKISKPRIHDLLIWEIWAGMMKVSKGIIPKNTTQGIAIFTTSDSSRKMKTRISSIMHHTPTKKQNIPAIRNCGHALPNEMMIYDLQCHTT